MTFLQKHEVKLPHYQGGLVVSRTKDQEIYIIPPNAASPADWIVIKYMGLNECGNVKLGFQAGKEYGIFRKEILEKNPSFVPFPRSIESKTQ